MLRVPILKLLRTCNADFKLPLFPWLRSQNENRLKFTTSNQPSSYHGNVMSVVGRVSRDPTCYDVRGWFCLNADKQSSENNESQIL